jgi:hypothetical protein
MYHSLLCAQSVSAKEFSKLRLNAIRRGIPWNPRQHDKKIGAKIYYEPGRRSCNSG